MGDGEGKRDKTKDKRKKKKKKKIISQSLKHTSYILLFSIFYYHYFIF